MNKSIKKLFENLQNYTVAVLYLVCLFFSVAYSCRSSTMSDSEDLIGEPCENMEILKILNDEPGFIRYYTHPLVDRLIYYFFEPFISSNELYEPLFLWKTNDYQGETDLNKYINKIVKVSGNVTNCLLPITEFPCDHCPSIEVEYNILDVSSIKLVEECISCENKEYIIEVLNDEPAYIRKECLEYLGQRNKFFFDLEDKRTNDLWFGLFPCGEI